MDFSKLRATALESANDEEAVTVNTRALIDKVLARYSGEWTTLRELIQNAADAQASTVKIKFESFPSSTVPLPSTTNRSEILKHVLVNHTLQRLVVTNDGVPFGINDWTRLKRIAEGNPDETKIGAFGVGFYSVFADCEEPFVSSGDQAMAFYWKGNALFTRKTQLPAEQTSKETNFVLDYRNTTTPMPNLLSISQFLATSLTFVALQHLELWVDDYKITSLHHKVSPGVDVPISKSIKPITKQEIMKIQSLERESVQMDATFMNVVGWKPAPSSNSTKMPGSFDNTYGTSDAAPTLKSFFSRISLGSAHDKLKTKVMKEEQVLQEIVLEDVTATTTVSVFLRVTTATVRTHVSASFAEELERATKKPPPKVTRPAILTASYDETAASTEENAVAKGVDIFASVLPGKQPGGRIFIGFPTHQTTGGGMHISAPSVIPTVERESIDLNARWVRTWNQEMLRAAGIMARLAFMNEMKDLSDDIKRAVERAGRGSKVSKVEVGQFTPRALHILNTFAFKDSTPSRSVREIIEEAFWFANERPEVDLLSTRGVLPNSLVRIATEDFSGFVEGIPVVPEPLVKDPLIQKMVAFGLISEITNDDVRKELSAKALSGEQLTEFLKWICRKAARNEMDNATIRSLLDVAVATTIDANGNGSVIALGGITNYLNVKMIPADVPIPATCMPFEFARTAEPVQMQLLGWEALEIIPWLRHLIETNKHRPAGQDYTKTVAFAAHILLIIHKGWSALKDASKNTIIKLLQTENIIPTKLGMKKPTEAYLASVKLFDDLPNIVSCPGLKEKFLVEIGLRKTVELDTVFSRLLAPPTEGNEDNDASGHRFMNLIKYLASVHEDIPSEDMKKLKNAKFCPAEAGPKGMESTKGTARKYSVKELFEPKDDLRQLGLPILRWPGPPGSYRVNTSTGQFLSSLGLRPFPSVPELVDMMAAETQKPSQKSAMEYFIANHQSNGYYQYHIGTTTKKFLPTDKDGEFVSPVECFTNSDCAVFGFKIFKPSLHSHANKFDVAVNPNITECVRRLVTDPPKDRSQAIKKFDYMSSRTNEFSHVMVKQLSEARIVPVMVKKSDNADPLSEKVKMLTPLQCYIGSSSTYSDIFEFVDFTPNANLFLFKCGSKSEPTIIELATLACNEPARLLGVLQSPEKYLNILRRLADERHQLRNDKPLWKRMKGSKFLLGEAEVSADEKRASLRPVSGLEAHELDFEENDTPPVKQYLLAMPVDVVVIDDFVSYRLFKSHLVTAVEDEKLEGFYMHLGAPTLSSMVQNSLRLGQPYEKQDSATELRDHVLERAKLFIHELKPEEIKHDYKWLEKNLKAEVVSSIELRRSLRGTNISHREKMAAACENTGSGYTLFITMGKANMYQISASLCKLILERPGQSHMITFEQFLTLSLMDLKRRGYNVDRILRLKAAERRVAEEERQKQLALEQEHLRQQEDAWTVRHKQPVSPAGAYSELDQMPGSFGADSPEDSLTPYSQNKGRFSSLFSRGRGGIPGLAALGEQFQKQLQSFENGPFGSTPQGQNEIGDGRKGLMPPQQKPRAGEIERVTSPAAVSQNLMSAIQASRPHNSDHLFSPPTTNEVKEEATYCDSTSEHDIAYLAETANGTRVFINKDHPAPQDFLRQNVQSINDFAVLLHEICGIYTLDPRTMHIFYDPAGRAIAFNAGGSIFCNYRYFLQLHKENLAASRDIAGAYWWVVVAHELAHNLVAAHDSQHSYYTENMVAHYFPRMMAQAQEWTRRNKALPAPEKN